MAFSEGGRFLISHHEKARDEDKLPMDGRFTCEGKGSFTNVQAGLVNISTIIKEDVFKGLLDLDKVKPQEQQWSWC